ncbi:RNA helicase [Candidatus Woesearchaeota archaeon CG10_big_fil_rev_8_21_14_0_10_37_12]|nr:MAG: RNA helicase [Candidatus Woesearchaeota archaeon CG10_big_fil_rev_8_21_14_0_10_37_12]
MKFEELNLNSELLKALKILKYDDPTEVQEKAIPLALSGKDVIVRSKTGSGKTFAFALPIINMLSQQKQLQAIILAPTRELAQQIDSEVRKLDRATKTILLYGGVSISPQISALDRGAHIVIATPGRLLDHIERKTIDLSAVRFVVLDEADRMLDMGFIDDVERILAKTPKSRQTMLFSATMPEQICQLSQRYMNNPEQLMLQQDEITVKQIRQQVFGVDRKQKLSVLTKILRDRAAKKTIVFVNTKDWAKSLSDILYRKGFRSTSIHSGLSQSRRNVVIHDFNAGKYTILVATDVAARGLHIEGVTHVVNYDIPRNPKDYVHRIGRTGRAGKEGDAVTFVTQVDQHLLRAVEDEIQMRLEVQDLAGLSAAPIESPMKMHHPVEQIKVHTHSDSSGDDWGLD